MNAFLPDAFPRRDFLKGAGALIVGFTLANSMRGAAALEIGPYGPPEDQIDSWIAIAEDGHATLFTGCCELGTGSSTGLMQIMAEELDLPFERVRLVGPDTNRTPDQFVSSGSRTISAHSRPIRQAAAEARAALVDMAAKRLECACGPIGHGRRRGQRARQRRRRKSPMPNSSAANSSICRSPAR